MSNITYHGTSKHSAQQILGPPLDIKVNVGTGELGQGFYTGSSIALAAMWAYNRYQTRGVVIKLEIPESDFVKLRGKLIKRKKEVRLLWNRIMKIKNTFTY